MNEEDVVYRLRNVENNEPDRISDLLEEAANEIEELRYKVLDLKKRLKALYRDDDRQANEQQDRGDR